jgi:5-formyltetrahydrofolate cyclo-ligase
VVKQDKQDVRKTILTLLKNQKEEDRLRKSAEISAKLFRDPDFANSKTVLFYASFKGEVETFDMMRQALKDGKRIALPRVDVKTHEIIPKLVTSLEEDLEYGPYNIQQPKQDVAQDIDIRQIDLVVVPGVAFDRKNHRLGRGVGYYDRFLVKFPQGIPLVGLAFDFQVLATLPIEPHDLSVTRIVTN